MILQQGNFSMSYVYNPIGTEEFKNITVEMKIGNNDGLIEVLLSTEDEISKDDLEGVLNSLHKEHFLRIKINLITDCTIVLCTNKKFFRVILSQNSDTRQFVVEELRAR